MLAPSTSAWGAFGRPALAPTPRAAVLREGSATLYRFDAPAGAPAAPRTPVLIVPSLINRWYVVDLRRGASLVEGLLAAGLDVWCYDWGVPHDEDRYLDWDAVLRRLARAVRRVSRDTGAERVALLGYCMGATVAGIYAALHSDSVAAFVNLLGPFDFRAGGALARAVDARWFDADAVADAGNVSPQQMQSGFVMLRPTQQVAKWVGLADRAHDEAAVDAFVALETWASDNIPFPAAAYRTYIRELYQQNGLVTGTHRALGRRVDLAALRCPILAVVAERDTICPPDAATALCALAGSADTDVLRVPGGHVGAVVGSRARERLYPHIARWLRQRLT
ncbi:MAG: alpha/beta fold hydrolase [Deltaproteobacteria bacterium]|nr:MAG: alpha/beta fold hydrolase [Deltaproteobacteria bacterium]